MEDIKNNINYKVINHTEKYSEHKDLIKIKDTIHKNIDYIINQNYEGIKHIINNLKNDLYTAKTFYELDLILDITNEIIKLHSFNDDNIDSQQPELQEEQYNTLVNRIFNK